MGRCCRTLNRSSFRSFPRATLLSAARAAFTQHMSHHARGAGRTVALHGSVANRAVERRESNGCQLVRRHGVVVDLTVGSVVAGPALDMYLLLEVALQREAEEPASGSNQLHACAQAALHQSQIATGEVLERNGRSHADR